MTRTLLGRAALLSLSGLLAGCAPEGIPEGEYKIVEVRDDYFQPQDRHVNPQQPVRWVWAGGNMHSVTFDAASGGAGVSSPVQDSGTHERVFTVLGIYSYYCTVHPDSMRGTIVVEPIFIPPAAGAPLGP